MVLLLILGRVAVQWLVLGDLVWGVFHNDVVSLQHEASPK